MKNIPILDHNRLYANLTYQQYMNTMLYMNPHDVLKPTVPRTVVSKSNLTKVSTPESRQEVIDIYAYYPLPFSRKYDECTRQVLDFDPRDHNFMNIGRYRHINKMVTDIENEVKINEKCERPRLLHGQILDTALISDRIKSDSNGIPIKAYIGGYFGIYGY